MVSIEQRQLASTALEQPDPYVTLPEAVSAGATLGSVVVPRKSRRLLWRFLVGGVVLVIGTYAAITGGKYVAHELRTSELQARYLTILGRQLGFSLAPGASPAVRFPASGPYDEQLGYTRLSSMQARLTAEKYQVEVQARLTPRLQQLIDWGIFPIYREKSQAGLRIFDRYGVVLHDTRYPERLYGTFAEVPVLIVHTLLFLENRELLADASPYRNPAVEWDRFAKAVLETGLRVVTGGERTAGGSTLATQIEKFRHSPDGRTNSIKDKLRQMASASIRAYQHGAETLSTRQQIIVDYLNTLPLAAMPGYGEVRGLGDGLWAWYDTDFAQANALLAVSEEPADASRLAARARAYKQVLSLLLALRRPSFYLHNPEALNAHTDSYLRVTHQAGLISTPLRDAALQITLQGRRGIPREPEGSYLERKGVNAVRTALLSSLGVSKLYELDRFDLTVQSTLDASTQGATTKLLQQLSNPAFVAAAGLQGEKLLDKGKSPAKVSYSFTLYERTPQANLLRVHTDTVDQPFDANRGMQLDLGSTAKLRTLVSYLEIIARLHTQYASLSRQELTTIRPHPSDRLSLWALQYLNKDPNPPLLRMLNAAMDRQYSASPGEAFFTGGGLHTFENFNKSDNGRIMPVREAFRHSVNLVFIRMMRDIVYYHMYDIPGSTAKLFEDINDPQREQYLLRFIDKESQTFLHRFYRKYAGKSPEEILDTLLDKIRLTPERLATVYGVLEPTGSFDAFTAFMGAHLQSRPTDTTLSALYTKYATAPFTLGDRGYLTRTHPLEIWVAAYLRRHPEASRQELTTASVDVRREVYQWLFKTRHRKQAQDVRIRTILEAEAFLEIHQSWQRLGYPFPSLVPSYATSIGSSGDRPEALAELMGILVNDGVRRSSVSVQQMHFAANTPYETRFGLASHEEQVLPAEVATVVKQALFDVVERGTARRGYGTFKRADGVLMPLGGKTGTGDHRHKGVSGGRAISRAGTFVFMIDDRFFGTLTAYVTGSEAGQYHFTSALPVSVLKLLAPVLQPMLQVPPASSTPPSPTLAPQAHTAYL